MDKDVAKVKFYLKNHKIVIYVLIVFLAILTYLTIVVAQELSSEQALQGQSR